MQRLTSVGFAPRCIRSRGLNYTTSRLLPLLFVSVDAKVPVFLSSARFDEALLSTDGM